MSTAREDILNRVRRAGAHRGPRSEDYSSIPRQYRCASELDRESRLHLFAERLRDYGSGFYSCIQTALAETICEVLHARGKRQLLIPENVPSDWLPEGFEFSLGSRLNYRELDDAEGVVTTCLLAIALTGTLIIQHTPRAGRRALTLIPDYHLCVVCEDQVVETVPEAMAKIASAGEFPLTTISGPSATADIEMTRVKGVHGPRFMDAILVTS